MIEINYPALAILYRKFVIQGRIEREIILRQRVINRARWEGRTHYFE